MGIILVTIFTLSFTSDAVTLSFRNNREFCVSQPLVRNLKEYHAKNALHYVQPTEWVVDIEGETEAAGMKRVCKVVTLEALGHNATGEVISNACRWLYNDSQADELLCKQDLYHYCFTKLSKFIRWTSFLNTFCRQY